MECCSDYRPSLGTSIVLLLLGEPNTMLTNELVALPSPINCQCRIDGLLRLSRVKKNKLLIKFACGPWGVWGCVLHSAVLRLACRRATLPQGCVACCWTEIVECPHLALASAARFPNTSGPANREAPPTRCSCFQAEAQFPYVKNVSVCLVFFLS